MFALHDVVITVFNRHSVLSIQLQTADDAFHDVVHKLHEGVFYLRNVIRVHGAHVILIYFKPIRKERSFLLDFQEIQKCQTGLFLEFLY